MRPARPQDGVAWITGASAGIGRAVALRLLADGWTVAITARRAEVLDQLATANQGRVIAAPGDITDAAAMRQAMASAQQGGRTVALAILNAGTYVPLSGEKFDLDAFRQQIEINVIGCATSLAAVLPGMVARRSGQIAIVASVAGYRGLPTGVGYGASKAALNNMAESLKFDLDRSGVMVNIVNPGFVRTPLTDKNEFPMPFLLEADDAADRIVRGLQAGHFEITFPKRFTYMLKALRLLPNAVYFPLVGRATRGKA